MSSGLILGLIRGSRAAVTTLGVPLLLMLSLLLCHQFLL